MRPIRPVVATLLLYAAWSCADVSSITDPTDPWGLGGFAPTRAVVPTLPPVCGAPQVARLIADETVPVGTVEITQGGGNLYVTYRTAPGWPIRRTALYVSGSLAGVPLSGGQNPQVGRFPFRGTHANVSEVIWEIPLVGAWGPDLVVAAFAEVGSPVEGAWAEGALISTRGNWSTYVQHSLANCAVATTDASGGTVVTPDGAARIVIGPGALPGPVDITIEPATVGDLLEHTQNRAAQASSPLAGPSRTTALPSVEGLTPIEGTIWDFGPDGLEFLEPVTVVLHYDDALIPDGVAEEELGVFIINGVIPFLPAPSVVDALNNTVTATIEHFSYAFIAYLPPADADLSLSALGLSASSEARVGRRMDFFADVTNLGPDASNGGTVTYQAFGDLVLGDLFGSCVEVENPSPVFGDVVITCDVAPLAAGANDGIEAFQLIAQSVGEIEVWATVSSAPEDTDSGVNNNRRTLQVDVGPAVAIDLEVTSLFLSASSEPKVGARMDFMSDVKNLGPDATGGGTLTYQAFGDVELGNLFGSCAEIENPIVGDVAVSCAVAPLAAGANDGIEAFQLIAQSVGNVEVWASVSPAPGETDLGSGNNQRRLTVAVGPAVAADLEVASLFLSASSEATAGEPMDFMSDVRNLGPDATSGGTLTYQAFGDVVLGGLFGACAEVENPPFGDVVITCPVAPLAANATDGIEAFQVIAQSGGAVEVWATVSPAPGETDLGATNNRRTLEVQVPKPEADLRVDRVADTPDPVVEGGNVTYEVDVIAMGTSLPVEGPVFQLLFTNGDATFVSSDAGCSVIAGGVGCPLGTLQPGLVRTVEVVMTLPTGGQTVSAEGRVIAPATVTDPDATNNSRVETTTVQGVTPPGPVADLSVLSVVESADPIALGASATYRARITNAGPDPAPDGVVRYQAFGNVVAGPLSVGCAETAQPVVGDVEIVCAAGTIPVDDPARPTGVLAPPASFTPQEPGVFAIWVSPGSSASDPSSANDRLETTITVTGPQADLRVDRLVDGPDPVQQGEDVTYEVDVVAVGTTVAVTGAVLQLLFTNGDASLVSSDAACTEIAGGVGCPLGTLQPGVVRTVEVVMTLPTAGQTVSAEARVVAPAGLTDPNLTNNSRSTTTEVWAPPPVMLGVGDIVEAVLPTPPDSGLYTVEAVAGEHVRLQLALLSGVNTAAQLVVRASDGTEIFPDNIPRGRATDLNSANVVLPVAFSTTLRVQIAAFGSGTYRLGRGTGAGRLDVTYGSDGSGVSKTERISSGDFLDMQLVGSDLVTVGISALSRYDSDGLLVPGFGAGGQVNLQSVLGAGRWGEAMRVQPDGRIVVAARTTTSPYPWVVARFDATGVLDPTFGTGGIAVVQMGTRNSSAPLGVRFQQNGAELDIVVAGNAGELQEQVGIVRLNPNGTLDSGFGTGGIVMENGGFAPDGLAVQSNGSILITDTKQIRRYTTAGARDATFGVDGLVTYGIAGNARGILVLPDDRLLVVGEQADEAFVMRRSANGVQDASFAGGGFALYDFGLQNRFQAVTLDATGALVVVGHQRTLEGNYEFLVVRMSAAGVLDETFGVAGYLTEPRTHDARAVAVDALGRILVGGQPPEANVFGIELSRHIPQ